MEGGSTRYGSLAEMVEALQAGGRYTFDRAEATTALQVGAPILKKAAMRLSAKKRIAVPTRGFYVVVPLEYRTAGAPPPSWYIDDLMRHLSRPYYVAILSAAALYGAAHQEPQEFQVITDEARRPMIAGRSRIRFLGKRHLDTADTTPMKTATGTMRVSTPESTAIDLVRYATAAGGLANVATVLSELAERLEPAALAASARAAGGWAYAQRLGYLLDLVGATERTQHLASLVAEEQPRRILLRPGRSRGECPTDNVWNVIVNEQLEVDL